MTHQTEYPFNLTKVLLGEEEALNVYLPGLYVALSTLNTREADILIKRFKDRLTLEQVAKIYSLTRERIRQIEAKAIRKLRHPQRINVIRGVSVVELISQQLEYQKLQKAYELLLDIIEAYKQNSTEQVIPAMHTNIPIAELDLSVRSYNCLRRAGKNTAADLLAMTRSELLGIRNLGKKSQQEIVLKLKEYFPHEKVAWWLD